MFLVDTNVWLEALLGQERSGEVHRFLTGVRSDNLRISEFSLYSIGIILERLKHPEAYSEFIQDTLVDARVQRIKLESRELQRIGDVHREFKLDFDDAYQYVAATSHNLELVFFDDDFDETDAGRITPSQALNQVSRSP